MNRISIATFNRRADAEPLAQCLNENGIPAEIHDDLMLGRLWFASRDTAGVRVEVPAQRFERAYNRALECDDTQRLLRGAIRCPECNSLRVVFPQFTKRSFIPNIIVGALAAIGRVEKEYYCEDCHFTWPREGHKQSKARPHTAPYYFIEGVEQNRQGEQQHHTT